MRGFARAFILGALLLPVWPVGPAGAQQRASCDALVNREPISDHGLASHPIDVEADDVLNVVALTRVPSDFFKVEVVFPLVTRTLAEETFDRPTTTAAARIDMTDVSDYGVGLYEVHVSVEGCERKVWVRIVGKSPLTTPAGLIVAGIATVGLGLVIFALMRTVRGKGGVVLALIGGAILGLGAVGVAQQFGWVGITDKILTTWTAFPALGAAALQQAAALVFRGRAVSAPPLDTAPPPPPSPPPPPTAPPPPPPSAPPTAGGDIPEWDTTVPPVTADGGDEEAPPRTAYARLECPEAAVAEEVFELIVGLSAEPTAGVVGEPLRVPASVVGDYTLTVQVVADGFALRGGRWRRDVRVTGADPYPFVVYKLAAKPQPADVWAKSIQALYSIDGQTIGMAVRSIAVVARADLLDRAPAMPVEPASTVGVPTDEVAADLTVRILQAVSESDGRLQWTFEAAAHLGIDTPDERIITDIGPSPQTFTKGLIEGVSAKHNDVQLFSFLRGIGSTIADQMPDEFFEILSAVAAKVGDRRLTLLLLSEEPYVPWELALLDPPLDPDTQPYLGAQVEVGRWVLGHRKPKLPPPVNVDVEALAVVAGVYDRAAWRLPEAEEEAATLTQTYGAISVDATSTAVYQCLDGDPAAEVLHFAVHGSYDPESVLEGLVLIDGKTLDLITVRGKNLTKAPLVFLNACQVGSGERVLGDYAGLAASFLRAGASGAIAPLWSIDDNAAKELALRFYERTLRDGETPAAVLRSERASFADPGRDGAATCLAYQFFGHPQMRLRHRR